MWRAIQTKTPAAPGCRSHWSPRESDDSGGLHHQRKAFSTSSWRAPETYWAKRNRCLTFSVSEERETSLVASKRTYQCTREREVGMKLGTIQVA